MNQTEAQMHDARMKAFEEVRDMEDEMGIDD